MEHVDILLSHAVPSISTLLLTWSLSLSRSQLLGQSHFNVSDRLDVVRFHTLLESSNLLCLVVTPVSVSVFNKYFKDLDVESRTKLLCSDEASVFCKKIA